MMEFTKQEFARGCKNFGCFDLNKWRSELTKIRQ